MLSATLLFLAVHSQQDSVARSRFRALTALNLDTLPRIADSLKVLAAKVIEQRKKQFAEDLFPFTDSFPSMSPIAKRYINRLKPDSNMRLELNKYLNKLRQPGPLLAIREVQTNYQYYYRSNIDTPFQERHIGQHSLSLRAQVVAARLLPLTVSYWGRRTNSDLFRAINDVQVSFDARAFAAQLQQQLRNRLQLLSAGLKDSVAGKLLALRKAEQGELYKWLKSAGQQQRLIQANEILKVPRITYLPQLSEAENRVREDSVRKLAAAFLELYQYASTRYDFVSKQVDTLETIYESSLGRVRQFKQAAAGNWMDAYSYRLWKKGMDSMGMGKLEIPRRYRWLMGIKQFNLGRSSLNYSELTAKNLSVNGINFEYNSWYYLAVTAGLIDYRFRDFVVSPLRKSPQYLYLLRLGIGNLSGNHFIVSGFRGQKQLFSGSAAQRGLTAITVTGYSLQARFAINKTSYLLAETAESVSPDFRNNPEQARTKFGLSDKSNNAFSTYFFSYLPAWGTRFEGMFKQSGANYQSFSSFQTNAGQKAWYLKVDQAFFKRQLRLSLAVRSNDFYNPFISQQYNSNTVFKSVSASFRKRKWPMLTISYLPMSQLTRLDNQLFEHRFQTINGNLVHLYKLYKTNAASSITYNRFFNKASDTGFIYFNAVNVFATQQLFFRLFTTSVSASYTTNGMYRLLVLDESLSWSFPKWGSLGMGIKINRYNEALTRLGAYWQASVRTRRQDIFSFSFERGFLPGYQGGLVRNELGSIQYSRTIQFK